MCVMSLDKGVLMEHLQWGSVRVCENPLAEDRTAAIDKETPPPITGTAVVISKVFDVSPGTSACILEFRE